MKRIAIIQVRTGSTRLPSKCLLHIFGRSMLWHIVRRVRHAQRLDGICIATTAGEADNPIAAIAEEIGIPVYRGSEDDVLDRYCQAARMMGADPICRITADDPMKDPGVLDRIMEVYENGSYDYVSNTMEPTYPDGLDIEVFSFAALERAWREANLPSEREHVTPYIWKHGEKFRTCNVTYKEDLSDHRWTMDYAEDWVFAQQVYDHLYREDRVFLMEDVLKLLEQYPMLREINSHIARNEGYLKSIAGEGEA